MDGRRSVTRPIIKLPPDIVAMCIAWAERSVLGYARGEKEASRKYARPGIDKKIRKQALGPLGESTYAIFFNQNPKLVVDWGPRISKPWDLLHCKLKIDVKGSDTHDLIWPVTKNSFLKTHDIDLFALACCIKYPDTFEISGWVSLKRFIERHHVAQPPHRYDPETKYMERDELWAAGDLAPLAVERRKQFEFISDRWP